MKQKTVLIIAITIIIAIMIIINQGLISKNPLSSIRISGIDIYVQIAKTPRQIEKGLGGQNSISEKEGMLFIMPSAKRYLFWMKDMKFPIDIIWIYNNNIIDINKNIPISNNSDLPVYKSIIHANYVLEVKSGFSDRYKIKVGDAVEGLDKIASDSR